MTTATMEAKIVAFDNRFQKIYETEDEFMFFLVKFYRVAEPGATEIISKNNF